MKNRIIKTKYTVFLAILCAIALSSCDKEIANSGRNSKGNTYLKVSVKGITEPPASEFSLKSAETVETITVPGDGLYDLSCTLERIPLSATRATNTLPKGTTYRVIVYKGTASTDVNSSNYVGYKDYVVGSESSVPDWYFPEIGNYYAVCYSYSNSSAITDVITSASTALPSNISPSTDVLYFATTFTLTANNVYELAIDFSHVFSRVKVIVDASSLGEVVTKASAKLTPTYSAASLSLATGTATPTVTSAATPIVWKADSLGKKAVNSDTVMVCMGNTIPTLTFDPGTIRSGASSTDDMPNKGTQTVTFTDPIEQGYRYVLRVNLLIPKLKVVVLARDTYYGYAISNTEERAGSILNSKTNFGPAGTVVCAGFDFVATSEEPADDKIVDWITGSNLSGTNPQGKIADLVYIAYYHHFNTTDKATTFAKYLKKYMERGGVVVLFPNYNEGRAITTAIANEILKPQTEFSSVAVTSLLNYAGSVHALPGNTKYYSSDQTFHAAEAMSKYANDPILNGPFGDARDKQWGNDADNNFGVSGLPPNNPNLHIYSTAVNIAASTISYGYSPYVTGFRYETELYNWVFFSDGGFMSLNHNWTGYGTTWTWVNATICPLNVTTDPKRIPLLRPNFGSPIQYSVANTFIFANTMAWAIKKSYYYAKKRYYAVNP